MEDALDFMMDYQFAIAQRQDITVTFVEPVSGRALRDIQHLPGVVHCEPFRAMAVRLRSEHHARRIGIMGLESQGELYRVIDQSLHAIHLPAEGLVLSQKLGEVLGVRPGDELTVEVLEGARPIRQVRVAGLIADYTGMAAYMERRALNRLVWEGDTLSGAFLAVDRSRRIDLETYLKQTPRVASVASREAALRSFRDTLAENLMVMRTFQIIFATIIAFGVVYNNARIGLSERSRELATLRVIGFTRAEISAIFLGEHAVLTLVAVPFGLLLGYVASGLVTLFFDTELYRIPLVVDLSTFAFAATVVLVATVVSGLLVRRQLDHLDLVAVLKSKE
jgi:putative ABC transport system permease protein